MRLTEAIEAAQTFLTHSWEEGEPLMAVDAELITRRGRILVVPYNAVQYLASRDARDMLLGCPPLLVDLDTGHIAYDGIGDRYLWREAVLRGAG
ncbi:YrhB domain-containing protein [Actinomycetota bacterium Odt1-20B]